MEFYRHYPPSNREPVQPTKQQTVDTTLQATDNRPNGQRRENNFDPGGLGRKFAAGQWKRRENTYCPGGHGRKVTAGDWAFSPSWRS
ncbi:unnamed protein product [Clonostachys rhizophaga]|uniref:Uncharacterized protein n=1 Tax=Clonostachys rhizophaga TaxID=160324 RepID=A0A9N9YI27_9HYPO|nr:unnamed protein product [Clonostachys rhizophaga]